MELSKTESGVMDFQTLMKQFEGYTNQEAEKEKLARKLRVMVGHTIDRVPNFDYQSSARLIPPLWCRDQVNPQ